MTSVLLEAALALLAGALLIRPIRMLVFGRLDAPSVPTPRGVLPYIVEELKLRAGDVVYDLGSGYGGIVLRCAEIAPTVRFVSPIGLPTGKSLFPIRIILRLIPACQCPVKSGEVVIVRESIKEGVPST